MNRFDRFLKLSEDQVEELMKECYSSIKGKTKDNPLIILSEYITDKWAGIKVCEKLELGSIILYHIAIDRDRKALTDKQIYSQRFKLSFDEIEELMLRL